MTSVDWEREFARAGNQTNRTLLRLGQRLGWVRMRGGKHADHLRKGGRLIVVPRHPRPGTVRRILRELRDEAESDDD